MGTEEKNRFVKFASRESACQDEWFCKARGPSFRAFCEGAILQEHRFCLSNANVGTAAPAVHRAKLGRSYDVISTRCHSDARAQRARRNLLSAGTIHRRP